VSDLRSEVRLKTRQGDDRFSNDQELALNSTADHSIGQVGLGIDSGDRRLDGVTRLNDVRQVGLWALRGIEHLLGTFCFSGDIAVLHRAGHHEIDLCP
jgi:hypothetical protein